MSKSEVTVMCPGCKNPFTIPGGRFEADPELECPSCEHIFRSEEESLKPALDRIGRKLRDMQDLL